MIILLGVKCILMPTQGCRKGWMISVKKKTNRIHEQDKKKSGSFREARDH